MMLGHVRDNFPRVALALPGLRGPLNVEFLVDTGFDGELTLPNAVLEQLEMSFITNRSVLLADGSQSRRPVYTVILTWDDEPRATEVMGLEGSPLLGGELMAGCLLQIEMTDGGEVLIEAL